MIVQLYFSKVTNFCKEKVCVANTKVVYKFFQSHFSQRNETYVISVLFHGGLAYIFRSDSDLC